MYILILRNFFYNNTTILLLFFNPFLKLIIIDNHSKSMTYHTLLSKKYCTKKETAFSDSLFQYSYECSSYSAQPAAQVGKSAPFPAPEFTPSVMVASEPS